MNLDLNMSDHHSSIGCCLICGSRALKPLPRYAAHHLVCCRNCSFVFSSIKPTEEELNEVYSRYRRGESQPTALTLKNYQNTVSKLFELRKIRAVLDVGCGDGHLLASFKDHAININARHGIQLYGTEFDSESAKAAASRGVEIIPGGLKPQCPDQVNGFDAILFTEVIEHINNPLEIAFHFFHLLKPGGLLYITTPNFRSIESGLLGPSWGMVMYPEHLCYYTPETLHRLLHQVVFQMTSLFSKNISFFRLSQYWGKKYSKKVDSIDPEAVSSAAQSAFHRHAALRLTKILVNQALSITGTGSQLIAIYSKPEA